MESVVKLALNYLKTVPEELVKEVENQSPDPCLLCNREILLNPLSTYTVVSCGHVFHWNCLLASPKCPICTKEFEQNNYQSSNKASPSSTNDFNLFDEPSNKKSEQNNYQSSNETSPRISNSSKRNSLLNEPSNKKIKKLKLFIEELTNSNTINSSKVIVEEEKEENSVFFNLNIKITNAEAKYNTTNQEVIKCYYLFGKALSERLDLYKESYMEHEAQKMVNDEVRQQLLFTNNITEDVLRKRKEMANKIYYLFNKIGEEKIMKIQLITASQILKLGWKNIEYIVKEILKSESCEESVN